MKRIISILLCVSLFFVLAACGKTEQKQELNEESSAVTNISHNLGNAAVTTILAPAFVYDHPAGSNEVMESSSFIWEDVTRKPDGGYSLRGIWRVSEEKSYPIRYLYYANGMAYLTQYKDFEGNVATSYFGDYVSADACYNGSLGAVRMEDDTVYMYDGTSVVYEMGENGLAKSFTTVNAEGNVIEKQVLNDSGFPVEVHLYDENGVETHWNECTYEEVPVPQK